MLPPTPGGRHSATMMVTAEDLVGNARISGLTRITHNHLLTITDDDPIDRSCLMSPTPAAPAQGGHLEDLDPVRELDQACGSREQSRAEVRGDAECVDIDAELVDNVRQLLDVLDSVELRFVADEVVQAPPGGQMLDNDPAQIEIGMDLDGLGTQSEPARQDGRAGPVHPSEDESRSAA